MQAGIINPRRHCSSEKDGTVVFEPASRRVVRISPKQSALPLSYGGYSCVCQWNWDDLNWQYLRILANLAIFEHIRKKSRQRDSTWWPSGPKPSALPLSYGGCSCVGQWNWDDLNWQYLRILANLAHVTCNCHFQVFQVFVMYMYMTISSFSSFYTYLSMLEKNARTETRPGDLQETSRALYHWATEAAAV